MRKSVQVKQRDISDCGAACLASVAAYFGLLIPVSRIRQYAGTDKQGTSLLGLIDAAERLNFRAKGGKGKGMSLKGIPFPAIFHLVLKDGFQHFVVVYKIKRNRVRYMDPAIGKFKTEPISEFEECWSGAILLLLPAEHFHRGNFKKSVYARFLQLILPHRKLLLQALLGALVYTMLGLTTSIYVQKIIDFVIPDSNRQLMNMLGVVMVLLLSFQILMGYFKSLLALRSGLQIDSWLILGYYRHLLGLPKRFFDTMRVGEIISRVNDALRIRVFINDIALSVVVHSLTIILCITTMFFYYWKLALIMLLGIPIYLFIYLFSNRLNAKWQRKIMETGAALESQLVESIQGMTTIRSFGVQDYFILKTETKFMPFMQAIFTGSRKGLLLGNAAEWMTGMFIITILWTGSYMVMDRALSPGTLLSFFTLTAYFTTPVQALIGANRSMQDAVIAADRLFEIIDLETEDENKVRGIEVFPEGDLTLENLHFMYGPGNTVFEGLQCRIPAFQMTAVIGESGTGKSTLLSLIQKIYPPNRGRILIGGLDIQMISTDVIRNKIAAVLQETDLFQGTIISNIALGAYEPNLERIFEICQRLGLHEFISQLPNQYQTIIHENGINLSGGQKQRIGIARAIYRDPAILILDEATSALDPESERKVQETLRWFHDCKKTIIVIAHRLTTVKYCDSIIFLKQGIQAICGTHEELLSVNEVYSDWWKNAHSA